MDKKVYNGKLLQHISNEKKKERELEESKYE